MYKRTDKISYVFLVFGLLVTVQGRSYICKLWTHKTALLEWGVREITAPQAVAKAGYSGTLGADISWTPGSHGVSPWMIYLWTAWWSCNESTKCIMKMGWIRRMLDEITSQKKENSLLPPLRGKICFINPAPSSVRKMAKAYD